MAKTLGGKLVDSISDQMGRKLFPEVGLRGEGLPYGIGFSRWPDGTITIAGDPIGQPGWGDYQSLFLNYLGALIAKEAVERKMGGRAQDPEVHGVDVRLRFSLGAGEFVLWFRGGQVVECDGGPLSEDDVRKVLNEVVNWLSRPSLREGPAPRVR